MSENDFQNLDRFLRANRPESPAAPTNEWQKIQARLENHSRRPLFLRPAIWAGLGTVAAVLLVWFQLRGPLPMPPRDEAGLIIYSTLANFYDDEEPELIGDEYAELAGIDEEI